MSIALLIAASFSLGFFIESIIGFGGGLIAYCILGFFVDLKEMIIIGLYIGTCASIYIALTDIKSFNKKILFSVIPLSVIGSIIGVVIFTNLTTEILSLIFGILLMMLAIKTAFFDKFIFPKIFKNKLIFIGGISHGAFGIGGPFVVNAIKNDFKNKSELRTTMAVFFILLNFIRVVQLLMQNQLKLNSFSEIWWTVIPALFAIKIGHVVHLKISEESFKKGIAVMTIFAGIKFLSKIFS